MKRIVLCLLVLLLGLPVIATAQGELHWLSPTIGGNDAVMIVDNGKDWKTRLNLRSEQRKGSEIRGRIYTGTRVEIYQDNREWCTVGLNFGGGGILTGEVMKRYLTPLRNGFSALCPLAVAKVDTEVVTSIDMTVANLHPGDTAYVLAACGERYYLMVPGAGQGYAPVNAFEPLEEPEKGVRIKYWSRYVPAGGIAFADEKSGDEVVLFGGVKLEDCWQIAGESDWHVTFGVGIQRTPRVQGVISQNQLTSDETVPFEGEVYAHEKSFITCVGTVNGKRILRKTDSNGDIFWALGDVPQEAVRFEDDLYQIRCEADELLSQVTMNNIRAYMSKRYVLDERTSGARVTSELAVRCKVNAALVLEPDTGKLRHIRAWLEDLDGSYVTGGDLNPKTGEIIRWGCNA